MEEPKRKQYSAASKTDSFFLIETCSGYYWSCKPDPQGKRHLLGSDASDEDLGSALMDALTHSRFLPPKEHKDFYNPQANKLAYEEWVRELMQRHGYNSRQALFSRMDSCGIESFDGQIIIQPRCHVKLEVWDRKKSDNFEDVIVGAESLPAKVGAALRLGFSRCK